ncbi:helix-turn-helix transcriptional regulator [Actinocorallia lasiicapitis]
MGTNSTYPAVRHQRPPVGTLLRELREERRISQFALALQTEVSQRHLSFVETGRANPSPELITRLSDQLDLPLRERNRLLLAAGHAPVYRETTLDASELRSVRGAVRRILKAHEPAPALLVDRHWNIVERNRAVTVLSVGIADFLLEPPVNVMRISLHPEGLARRIINLGEWREHLLGRLRQQITVSRDEHLAELYDEVSAYPYDSSAQQPSTVDSPEILVPLRLRDGDNELAFISTMTIFGTALDITVAELAIESFFPADQHTMAALQARFSAEPAR